MSKTVSAPLEFPHRTTSFRNVLFFTIAFSCLLYAYRDSLVPQSKPGQQQQSDKSLKSTDFRWSDIVPSRKLVFHDCFGEFQCARLDVPLDWRAKPESQTKRIAVAILKLPAKVPVTDPRYGGAILTNPGGPGGSGVYLAARKGHQLQTFADAGHQPSSLSGYNDTGLYFDVVGFDPRGVNNTTPKVACFPDDFSQMSWHVQKTAQGLITSNDSFGPVFNRLKGLSFSCSEKLLQGDELGRFVSTPYVVEDMVEIAERLGEWREAEARNILASRSCRGTSPDVKKIIERTAWRKGREEILYWGFSYGTILGMTLATMHPSRVRRMIVDGVVDSEDYYSGTWVKNLMDTDQIMSKFFAQCHAAGATICPLFSSGGPASIESAVRGLLDDLKSNPLPVASSGPFGPDLITYTDIMALIKRALYNPSKFPSLATHLDALLNGNGTALAALKQSEYKTSCSTPKCQIPLPADFYQEAESAILCTDAPDLTSLPSTAFQARWHVLLNQSTVMGEGWTEVTLPCADWRIRSKWDFADITRNISGRPEHPILFMSSTLDPVTPLINARAMAPKFEGSGLLVQEGEGHCALENPSLCTVRLVREYFQTGKVPEVEKRCWRGKEPFGGDDSVGVMMDEEERELVEAIEKIAGQERVTSGVLGI